MPIATIADVRDWVIIVLGIVAIAGVALLVGLAALVLWQVKRAIEQARKSLATLERAVQDPTALGDTGDTSDPERREFMAWLKRRLEALVGSGKPAQKG